VLLGGINFGIALAQERRVINGKVSNTNGESIQGATILLKVTVTVW
jgi:hypothetical protein